MLTSNSSHIAVVRSYQSNLNEPNTSHTTALCSTKSIIKSIKQISDEANTERQANVFADSTSELQVRYPTWCIGVKSPARNFKYLAQENCMTKITCTNAKLRLKLLHVHSNTSNHLHKQSFVELHVHVAGLLYQHL